MNHVIVYSHFFTVQNPEIELRKILYTLAADYTVFGMVFDEQRRKRVWKPVKTFGFYTKLNDEFRFHIGQLNRMLQSCQAAGIYLDVYHMPLYEPCEESYPIQPKFVLRAEQEEAAEFIIDMSSEGSHAPLLSMPMGTGKFQPLSSMVKVPGGWKSMGDIKVGDYVTAQDGTPSRVTGVYPQGVQPVYRLRFFDGRSTRAGADHLWEIGLTGARREVQVVTTLELMRLKGLRSCQGVIFIPLIVPEETSSADLPIDPYLLGALIGDGSTVTSIKFTSNDPFVVNKLQTILNPEYEIVYTGRYDYSIKLKGSNNSSYNPLKDSLKKVRLYGKRAWEKFIPEEYLNASIEQRYELVRGLMDTDGYVGSGGNMSYTTTSKRLALQFRYLIRSLGGIASITSRIPSYTYKGEKKYGRLAYTIFIRHKTPTRLVSLPRRKERVSDSSQYCDQLMLRLESIEADGYEECQCIAIDHPRHLYVTDDFIATHNTVTSLVSASRLGNRLAVSVLAGYVEKWNKDVLNTYEIEQKDIYRIEGKNSLIDYCQLVLENQETPEKLPKVTIISINTISKWYKGYIEDPFNPTYDMYGMKPWELMEKARIGTNIFDESHQHLHAVYRMFCFLHIPKTISLSATLTSEDETELRIQRMMYPRHKRFEKIKMKRYITVYSCQYQIQDFANSRIRTQEYGSNNYSHIAFEKSILSSHVMKSQYVDMIVRMVKGSFVKTMQAGDKCAVFVSSHAMAREVCKVLRKALPDLDTRTYLESDPIENLMDSDIRVTTVLSGGTAHDIGGLTVSIQTINLNSIKSNLQVLGRLREIAGRDIRFYYLYCSSIPKHVEYHQNKIEMFRDWCKERKDVMLDPLVPKSSPSGYSGFKRFYN